MMPKKGRARLEGRLYVVCCYNHGLESLWEGFVTSPKWSLALLSFKFVAKTLQKNAHEPFVTVLGHRKKSLRSMRKKCVLTITLPRYGFMTLVVLTT
jgi:hypothetical protein